MLGQHFCLWVGLILVPLLSVGESTKSIQFHLGGAPYEQRGGTFYDGTLQGLDPSGMQAPTPTDISNSSSSSSGRYMRPVKTMEYDYLTIRGTDITAGTILLEQAAATWVDLSPYWPVEEAWCPFAEYDSTSPSTHGRGLCEMLWDIPIVAWYRNESNDHTEATKLRRVKEDARAMVLQEMKLAISVAHMLNSASLVDSQDDVVHPQGWLAFSFDVFSWWIFRLCSSFLDHILIPVAMLCVKVTAYDMVKVCASILLAEYPAMLLKEDRLQEMRRVFECWGARVEQRNHAKENFKVWANGIVSSRRSQALAERQRIRNCHDLVTRGISNFHKYLSDYGAMGLEVISRPFEEKFAFFNAFRNLVLPDVEGAAMFNTDMVSVTVVGEGASGMVSILAMKKSDYEWGSPIGQAIAVAEGCGVLSTDEDGIVKVAVKVAQEGTELTQMAEASLLERLPPHRNVVQLLAVRDDRPDFPLVLEAGDATVYERFCDKSSEDEDVDSEYFLLDFLRWLRDAGLGLQHIHRCGLVHHDVKQANLVVCPGSCKVIDLGLATEIGELSELGGTREHMPPEVLEWMHAQDRVDACLDLGIEPNEEDFQVVEGKPVACPSVDVYSLAVCVLQVVSSQVHAAGSDMELLIEEALEHAWELGGVIEEMRDLLLGSLHPDPHERWTMAQLCDGLDFMIAALTAEEAMDDLLLA